MTSLENAVWVDWRRTRPSHVPAVARIYIGHETCQHLLPPATIATELARAARDKGAGVTLVCPFLTDAGLTSTLHLIEELLAVLDGLEVAASDWGLLSRLRGRGAAPVLGRLLTAQVTDPRLVRLLAPVGPDDIEREVMHADGTRCVLRRCPPSPSLALHYRSVWCDRPSAVAFLTSLGIGRCELSGPAHGLELDARSRLRYSLHVPDVLVAAMRHCPGEGEDLNAERGCRPERCSGREVQWRCDGLGAGLFRRDNALFYRSTSLPPDLASLPVDRLVRRPLNSA